MTLFQKVLDTLRGGSTTSSSSSSTTSDTPIVLKQTTQKKIEIPNLINSNNNNNYEQTHHTNNDSLIINDQIYKLGGLVDFEIFRTLGTGSYGRVLLSRHKPSLQFFAIKKLRKSDIIRLRQVEHTNNECKLLKQVAVNTPFIVGLRGTFQDKNNLYLILDYVAGGELFNLLRKLKTLPVFVAQFYAAQVAYTLASLHFQGIIYRDLKPENLLLDRNGYLRMADFGFAKELPAENPITWTFCGTPEYLAPEIISSSGYGPGVDWWALGVLIYEMLTGHPPFYHENHLKLYDMISNGSLKFPDYFDYNAKDLVSRLLERTPIRRLGVLVNGPNDVLNHPWFRGIDWEKLATEQIRPPFKPKVVEDGDSSNFDSYPEETSAERALANMEDPSFEKFPNFPVIVV